MLHHLLFLKPSIEGVSVTTENLIFKLIYAVTCPIFLAFGVIFYTRLCFTDPINCVSNSTESFKVLRAIDSYCLENSYIVTGSGETFMSKVPDAESVENGHQIFEGISSKVYQSNYQYIGIFFVISGALCYLPYVLWEWCENGLLKSLLQDYMSVLLDVEYVKRLKQLERLSNFWKGNKSILESYGIAYIFCEIFNLICILLVFVLSNCFLGGNFLGLGLTTLKSDGSAFPKSTNCSWSTVGLNGNPVVYEGVCTMNLNYLSEKMFYFSWCWLVSTAALCIGNLAYRYTVFKNPDLRSSIIMNQSLGFVHRLGLVDAPKPKADDVGSKEPYLKAISYGEFFMIKRFQANVMPDAFEEILDYLSQKNIPSGIEKKEE